MALLHSFHSTMPTLSSSFCKISLQPCDSVPEDGGTRLMYFPCSLQWERTNEEKKNAAAKKQTKRNEFDSYYQMFPLSTRTANKYTRKNECRAMVTQKRQQQWYNCVSLHCHTWWRWRRRHDDKICMHRTKCRNGIIDAQAGYARWQWKKQA